MACGSERPMEEKKEKRKEREGELKGKVYRAGPGGCVRGGNPHEGERPLGENCFGLPQLSGEPFGEKGGWNKQENMWGRRGGLPV